MRFLIRLYPLKAVRQASSPHWEQPTRRGRHFPPHSVGHQALWPGCEWGSRHEDSRLSEWFQQGDKWSLRSSQAADPSVAWSGPQRPLVSTFVFHLKEFPFRIRSLHVCTGTVR